MALSLAQRSATGLDMSNDSNFYYLVLTICTIFLFTLYRLINSRFGRVIQAIKENETRMEAIGYPVFRYKLLCFAIAGSVAQPGRCLAGKPEHAGQPQPFTLDTIRQPDGDGDTRRCWLSVGRHPGCGSHVDAGRNPVWLHHTLAIVSGHYLAAGCHAFAKWSRQLAAKIHVGEKTSKGSGYERVTAKRPGQTLWWPDRNK